jgi:hypothetical protein
MVLPCKPHPERPSGGRRKLVLDGNRLEFRPHGFDRALSGKGMVDAARRDPLGGHRAAGARLRGRGLC